MRKKLTDEGVAEQRAPAGKRLEIFDKVVPALAVRVTPAGGKTWIVRGRVKGHTSPIRVTVGDASVMAVEDARDGASAILAKLRAGIDPRDKDQATIADPLKWENVAATFVEKHAKKNRTWKQTETYLAQWVTPHWRGRAISAITRADVATVIDAVEEATSPANANRVLAAVRKLFNWAIDRGLIETTPITKGMVRKGEIVRSRFLSLDEIAAVWRAAEGLGQPFGPWFKLLMLTGQRRGECARAKWSGFDLENRQAWSLTPEETKAARAHLVPLTPLALKIVKAQDKIGDPAVYVFTTTGKTPISGYDYAKRAIDAELANAGDALPAWRIHDLRRTVATHMQATLGINLAIVGAVLNHAPSTITGKVYAVGDMEFDMRVALSAWARLLSLAVEGGKAWKVASEFLTQKTDAQRQQKAEFRRLIQADDDAWAKYADRLANPDELRGAA